MTSALLGRSTRDWHTLIRRGLAGVRAAWWNTPGFVRIFIEGSVMLIAVTIVISKAFAFSTEAGLSALISIGALVVIGLILDLWRIGFRWHAQRVLYGWKMLFPSNRLLVLPYRRAFVGMGLAFTAPSLYANFRRTATDSKRLSRLVRANRRSGARVFRRHAQAFTEMLVAVPDSELQTTMTALVRHAKTDGTAHVARYFSFTPAVALAALDAGIPPEYAVMLPEA